MVDPPWNTVRSAESVMLAPVGSPAIVTVNVSSLSTFVTVIAGSLTVPPSLTVAVVAPSRNVGGSGPSPVSTVKLPVVPAAPGLPLFSCQLPAITPTEALLMSVLAAPVKVAV